MVRQIRRRDIVSILIYIGLMAINFLGTKIFKTLNYSEYYLPSIILILGIIISIIFYNNYKKELKREFRDYRERRLLNILIMILGLVIIHLILRYSRVLLRINTSGLDVGDSKGFLDTSEIGILNYLGLLALGLIPMFSAFMEEIIFRYLFIGSCSKVYGREIIFLTLSSILFGLIHYFNLGSIYNTIPYMLVGLFFGIIYVLTDNIFYSLSIHLLNNFLLSILPILFIGIINIINIFK